MKSILFLGASGQTGGPFLTSFRTKYPTYSITAFLRSTHLDSLLLDLNITPVHGTFAELSTIEQLASQHDIVINAATSVDTEVTNAILRGLALGDPPHNNRKTLLHLSGCGNFIDGRQDGQFVPVDDTAIWNDANPNDVKGISAKSLPNGPCDELVLAAGAKGLVNAYIVCPAGIIGEGAPNALLLPGAPPVPGVWVNYMLQNIATLGYSPYIGSGTSVWGMVHVDDVVTLMLLVFARAETIGSKYDPAVDPWRNFFVGYEEARPWKEVAGLFADLTGTEAKSVGWDEAGSVRGYIGGNMRVKSDNSRSLGWTPRGPKINEVLEGMKGRLRLG